MRRLSFYTVLCIICCAMLTSCEKEVNINLSSGETQIVVNGQIETGLAPRVVLTRSIGYFSRVDLKTLQNSFVHDAVITVSDGTRTITLREYSKDTAQVAIFYVYTIDSADAGSFSFLGEQGKSYTLTIESGGKRYVSTAKIPVPKPVDSVVAMTPRAVPSKAPTAMQLVVYYSDPDTPGNAVRYFTQRNHEPFYPGPNSVFDDAVINGSQNSQYPLQAGSPRSNLDFSDSTGYIFKGDTVTLKWAAIDRGVFNFYSTLEYSVGTVGNPFSSPINVQSNVSNGALGIWAAYGSTYKTIVVPK